MIRSRRLDSLVFGLRALLILSALAVLTVSGSPRALITVGAFALGYELCIGLLILIRMPSHFLRILSVIGDGLMALLFFRASDESASMLIGVGLFPILIATLGYGRVIGLLSATWLGGLALGLVALTPDAIQHNFTPTLAGILFLVLGALLVSLLSAFSKDSSPLVLDERIVEANRLRAARERARTMYQLVSTLGATLDYQKVLNALLDLGVHGLRTVNTPKANSEVVSAALVYKGKTLRVAMARGFTRHDEKVIFPGERGVLGLAVRQSEPVFAADAHQDPELQYVNALAGAQSIMAIPLRRQFRTFGVLLFASETPNAFSDDEIELLNAVGTQATIALQNAQLYQDMRQDKERLVEVEEEARKKLARDLHDGPTQSVSAIAMRVNFIRTLLERRPAEVPDELYRVEELARRTTKEIRHMLFTLRPLVLETQGLTPAFQQLAEKMKETHNQDVIVEAEPGIDDLIAPSAQGVLFYIVEEAVNNARKHAQAEQIYIRLYRKDENAVIEVQDNGVGFDVAAVNSGYDKRGSLGMINMRERAELAEGRLELQSAKGQGTRIAVYVPIQAADPNIELAESAVSIPTPPVRPLRSLTEKGNEPGDSRKSVLRSPAK